MRTRAILEMRFKDYVATEEELDAEMKQMEKALAMYRSQGNAPMVAKYELRIRDIARKKSRLTESTPAYQLKLKNMSIPQLQQELDDLESILSSAQKTEHGDDVMDDIAAVKAQLKRARA